MPLPAATLRYPHERELLHRTRLAYVHLRNLLTDAKRDRAARVYGYVAVWLPEEVLLLFLQEGEVVNATGSTDGRHFRSHPLAEALAMVPNAAEFGEVCFHECEDEQLACMYWSQVGNVVEWPAELNLRDPGAVLAFLNATMYDGMVEVEADGGVNYAVVRNGRVVRGFFADTSVGAADARIAVLLTTARGGSLAKLWPVPQPLPVQAPPALIQAYRDLMTGVVKRLVDGGATGAPAVAEHARKLLVDSHPALDRFSVSQPSPRDPVIEAPALAAAMGAWLAELLWAAAPPEGMTPERLIGELTRERRHVFQSAGLFDALPWKAEW
jgi:hypothetical protein